MIISTLEELKGLPGLSYLASPYSRYHAGLDAAYSMACQASAVLMKRGHRIFCPIAHSHPIATFGDIDPLDWEFWAKQDGDMMKNCNGLIILKMEGWEESVGVTDEIGAFEWMSKPCIYVHPAELGLVEKKRPSIDGMLKNPVMVI